MGLGKLTNSLRGCDREKAEDRSGVSGAPAVRGTVVGEMDNRKEGMGKGIPG